MTSQLNCLNEIKKLNRKQLKKLLEDKGYDKCSEILYNKGVDGSSLFEITEFKLISWRIPKNIDVFACILDIKKNPEKFLVHDTYWEKSPPKTLKIPNKQNLESMLTRSPTQNLNTGFSPKLIKKRTENGFNIKVSHEDIAMHTSLTTTPKRSPTNLRTFSSFRTPKLEVNTILRNNSSNISSEDDDNTHNDILKSKSHIPIANKIEQRSRRPLPEIPVKSFSSNELQMRSKSDNNISNTNQQHHPSSYDSSYVTMHNPKNTDEEIDGDYLLPHQIHSSNLSLYEAPPKLTESQILRLRNESHISLTPENPATFNSKMHPPQTPTDDSYVKSPALPARSHMKENTAFTKNNELQQTVKKSMTPNKEIKQLNYAESNKSGTWPKLFKFIVPGIKKNKQLKSDLNTSTSSKSKKIHENAEEYENIYYNVNKRAEFSASPQNQVEVTAKINDDALDEFYENTIQILSCNTKTGPARRHNDEEEENYNVSVIYPNEGQKSNLKQINSFRYIPPTCIEKNEQFKNADTWQTSQHRAEEEENYNEPIKYYNYNERHNSNSFRSIPPESPGIKMNKQLNTNASPISQDNVEEDENFKEINLCTNEGHPLNGFSYIQPESIQSIPKIVDDSSEDSNDDYEEVPFNLQEPYYKNDIDKKEAKKLLLPHIDGAFLFRPSNKYFLSLHVKYGKKVYKFHILKSGEKYDRIRSEAKDGSRTPEFFSLREFVDQFSITPLLLRDGSVLKQIYLNNVF